MTSFRAVTQSGAVYELKDNILHINSKRDGITVFKPWAMKSALSPQVLPWQDTENKVWHDTALPVIGERFYAHGKDEWRISTEMVSVESLPDEVYEDEDD